MTMDVTGRYLVKMESWKSSAFGPLPLILLDINKEPPSRKTTTIPIMIGITSPKRPSVQVIE